MLRDRFKHSIYSDRASRHVQALILLHFLACCIEKIVQYFSQVATASTSIGKTLLAVGVIFWERHNPFDWWAWRYCLRHATTSPSATDHKFCCTVSMRLSMSLTYSGLRSIPR